jgi:hypothetical protein
VIEPDDMQPPALFEPPEPPELFPEPPDPLDEDAPASTPVIVDGAFDAGEHAPNATTAPQTAANFDARRRRSASRLSFIVLLPLSPKLGQMRTCQAVVALATTCQPSTERRAGERGRRRPISKSEVYRVAGRGSRGAGKRSRLWRLLVASAPGSLRNR